MKQEMQLQAYVDGELNPSEASQVAARIQSEPEAKALYSELQQTAALFKLGEIERRLPESREFYWSKIEREIHRLDAAPATEHSAPWWLAYFRRHLTAISGLGVATVLLLVGAFQLNWVPADLLEEIDNPLDETTSFSFRSESQKMTVVWIADPSTKAAEDEPDPGEEFIQ